MKKIATITTLTCILLITFLLVINFQNLKDFLLTKLPDSISYIEPKPLLGSTFKGHDKTKRQILIMGYYGAQNYGDELMLSVLLNKGLIDTSNAEISVEFNPSQRYDFQQFPNIFAYYTPYNPKSLNISKIAEFYDELIIGGGAHLDDAHDHVNMMLALSSEMIKKGKKVRWIAVSANEKVTNKDFIEQLNFVIPHSAEFSLRDPYSMKVLSDSGINTEKVKLAEDLAFLYDEKKIIAVSLINFSQDKTVDKKEIAFVRDIISFIKKSNNQYEICFLPFYNKNHHDMELYENLIKKIDFEGVSYFIAPEYKNIDSMILMIKGADIFINMRYHASLLSMKYGKPTISIIFDTHQHYPNKMRYVHEQYKNDNMIFYSKYKKGDLEKMLLKIER